MVGIAALNPVAWSDESNPFALKYKKNKPRSYFWMPLATFFVPGLDQIIEGQWGYGGFYAGMSFSSLAYTSYNAQKLADEREEMGYDNLPDYEQRNRDTHGERERKIGYGSQLSNAMGGLSTYHAFRTAVRSRQPMGEFAFLTKEETPAELALAPFQFSHLTKLTTWIPLAVGVSIAALQVSSVDETDGYKKDAFSSSDAFYTAGTSYNAGVWEEAMFRGWLMPTLRETWGSNFWSNTATATVFGLLHLGPQNPIPVAQLGLGWYLGFVAQKREWTLSESIFIHAWWDVIALAAAYQMRETKKVDDVVLWLPQLQFAW